MSNVELSPIWKLVEDMPLKNNDKLLSYANTKIIFFTNGTYITNLVPTMAIVTGHVSNFSKSQAKVKQRTVGLADDRDVDKRFVVIDLHCWAALVQYTAEQDPVNALTIIKSYGYRAKQMPANYKKDFEVRHGKLSGTATMLIKSAGRNTYYERQMSTDGHAWTDMEGTMYCKYDIKSLTPGNHLLF